MSRPFGPDGLEEFPVGVMLLLKKRFSFFFFLQPSKAESRAARNSATSQTLKSCDQLNFTKDKEAKSVKKSCGVDFFYIGGY